MEKGRSTSRPDPDRLITVTLPWSHWSQIVSDIQNMCGRSDDIEILDSAVVSETAPASPSADDEPDDQ